MGIKARVKPPAVDPKRVQAILDADLQKPSPLPTLPWRKTDSNSRSLREGKGYGEPLQAGVAVSGLNL